MKKSVNFVPKICLIRLSTVLGSLGWASACLKYKGEIFEVLFLIATPSYLSPFIED